MRPLTDGVPRPITLSVKLTPEIFTGIQKLAGIDHTTVAFEAYLLLKQCVANNQQRINEYTAVMEKFNQNMPAPVSRQPIISSKE